jgi:hypothetical protein
MEMKVTATCASPLPLYNPGDIWVAWRGKELISYGESVSGESQAIR